MEQGNTTSLEMKNTYNITIRHETAMRMLGVILFYAVMFVAVSVFTN